MMFRNRVNQGENSLNAKLGTDIALQSVWDTPIGSTQETPYSGTFKGAGYAVTMEAVSETALFGCVTDSEIRNLTVHANISAFGEAAPSVGGIVNTNGGTVRNCAVSGSIAAAGADISVGGICGENAGTVTASCSRAALQGALTGGIAGVNSGSIQNCCFDSDAYSGSPVGTDSSTDTSACGKPADAFARGEVTWYLNGGDADGVWKQNLDNGETHDPFPNFAGAAVYFNPDAGIYTNTEWVQPSETIPENGEVTVIKGDENTAARIIVRKADGMTDLYLLYPIETLDYSRAGFLVTNGMQEAVWETDTVFESVMIAGETYTAAEFGGSYLVALKLVNVPEGAAETTEASPNMTELPEVPAALPKEQEESTEAKKPNAA